MHSNLGWWQWILFTKLSLSRASEPQLYGGFHCGFLFANVMTTLEWFYVASFIQTQRDDRSIVGVEISMNFRVFIVNSSKFQWNCRLNFHEKSLSWKKWRNLLISMKCIISINVTIVENSPQKNQQTSNNLNSLCSPKSYDCKAEWKQKQKPKPKQQHAAYTQNNKRMRIVKSLPWFSFRMCEWVLNRTSQSMQWTQEKARRTLE